MSHEFESELTGTRVEIAAVLDGVVDGLLTGSIRLGEGPDAVVVPAPDDLSLEIELETDGDELSLELELEWADGVDGIGAPAEGAAAETDESSSETDELAELAGAANGSHSLARFEVFRDRAEEWRWRLRHRNGNIIATSGEGYTRKHNAWKGLRSVMQNASGAELTEESGTE